MWQTGHRNGIKPASEWDESLEQQILELHAEGLIDITLKDQAKSGKQKSLATDKRITKTGR